MRPIVLTVLIGLATASGVRAQERMPPIAPDKMTEAQKLPLFASYGALESSKTVLLEGDRDVFGDGTVVLKSTPGHTPGHQSLFVKLAKTGPVLLTGDLYHYAAEKTMNTVPVRDYNREQTAASRAAIDAFLASAGAQLWIQHDIQKNATLKHAPQYYD